MRYGDLKKEWTSFQIGSYKYNYTFEIEKGSSYYFGIQPNWEKPSTQYVYCRLEFNPAKIGECVPFILFLNKLHSMAKHTDVKRFDLAIDIPYDRENVFLQKDQRLYKLHEYSKSNKTEYLGQRSQHGYVKLYNKQMESKLDYALTRLEITLDYRQTTYGEFERLVPKVLIIDDIQLSLEDIKLTETDRVLVLACIENPTYLKMLSRRKAYTKYKTGKSKPPIDNLLILADFYETSIDLLIGRYNKKD